MHGRTINTVVLDAAKWTQDGAFQDADGRSVRAYDDVELLRPIPIENDPKSAYEVPAGTVGTVLFHSGDQGPLEVELYWPEGAFVFGYCMSTDVRLHQTSEEKYPR